MNFYKNPHNTANQAGETEIKSEDSKLSVLFSNPITAQKTMPQNNRTSANRLYSGYSSNLNATNLNITYKQTLKIINEVEQKEGKGWVDIIYRKNGIRRPKGVKTIE